MSSTPSRPMSRHRPWCPDHHPEPRTRIMTRSQYARSSGGPFMTGRLDPPPRLNLALDYEQERNVTLKTDIPVGHPADVRPRS